MGKLFRSISSAVQQDRYLVSWHADERCEERGISTWQLVAGIEQARIVKERRRSKPRPSVVVHQELADGTEVEAVWAWLSVSQQALLVTVYFLGDEP